jgi:hypothetical protein
MISKLQRKEKKGKAKSGTATGSSKTNPKEEQRSATMLRVGNN